MFSRRVPDLISFHGFGHGDLRSSMDGLDVWTVFSWIWTSGFSLDWIFGSFLRIGWIFRISVFQKRKKLIDTGFF